MVESNSTMEAFKNCHGEIKGLFLHVRTTQFSVLPPLQLLSAWVSQETVNIKTKSYNDIWPISQGVCKSHP